MAPSNGDKPSPAPKATFVRESVADAPDRPLKALERPVAETVRQTQQGQAYPGTVHHGSQQEGGIGESFTGGIASLAPVTPGGSGAAPTGTATIGDFRQHLAIGTDVIADQGGAGMVDVGGGGGGFAQVTDTTPPSLADNGRPVTPTQSCVAQPGAGEAQTSSPPIRSAAAPAESTSFATPGPATTQTTGGETGTGSNTGSTGSTGAGLSARSLTISSAIGLEDQPVSLSIAAGLVGAATGEVLAVTITGVPVGASLSGGTKNADGTWTVGQSLLSTLEITPPTNDSSDFQLGISVKILGITTQIGLLNVNVEGVADLPTVTFSAAAGTEDQGVALSLGGVLGDLDGSEALSFVVKCLSAGTNNGNGTWTLTAAQLTGLKLTPPANSDADFNLGVTAKVTGLAGIDSSVSAQLHVTVLPVADMPSLNVAAAVGVSGHSIPLNIQSALTDLDGSEALHVTIAGVPVGGLLSAGTDNHDGTWILAPGDLPNLSLLAPDGSSGTVNLTVTATAVEGADNGRASLSANLSVAMTADTGALSDDILVASGMDLSLLGGQSVSRAIISLDPLDFHQGDSLSLAGLHLKTTATGKVMIASTNIELLDGGFDGTSHTLILSGTADASVYQSVLRSLSLEPGSEGGIRDISIDLYDQAGAVIPAGHHDLHHDMGNGGSAMAAMMAAPMPDMGGADTGGLDGALLSDGLHVTDPFRHDGGSSTVDPSNDPLHHLDPTGT